jgi:hypothetical protein
MLNKARTAMARLRSPSRNGEAPPARDLSAEHIAYIERRLHEAEHTIARLESFGLIAALADPPERYARWLTWRPPGHFYSPIPNLDELERSKSLRWPGDDLLPTALAGIDLRDEEQLALFSQVAEFARGLDIGQRANDNWRYHPDNVAYAVGDGLTLHGMLRTIRPQRLIEVGSGHSSAMMLDTVEHFLDGKTQLSFIEPYPQLLESMLRPGDEQRVQIVPKPVQDVPLELFETLESGDVLFIDSTHVVKTGNDVVWLYAEVLPRLKTGVHIHIHDMFYPFEYPKHWVMEGRAWGETYLVRAFLTDNPDFEISLFNTWLATFHKDRIRSELPAMLENVGGALWLRRVAKSR